MAKIAAIAKKTWHLSIHQRLFVLLCFCAYLIAYCPWSEPNTSIAVDVYAGSAAMIVVAVLPNKTRLIYAFVIALCVAFLVLAIGQAAHRLRT
jgi:hypothetical protein